MEAKKERQGGHARAHVVMLTYPTAGHSNPMVELAMQMARRDVSVTLVTFEHALSRLHKHVTAVAQRQLRLGVRVHVRLAAIADGLPPSHGLDCLHVLFHLTRHVDGSDLEALIRRLDDAAAEHGTPPVCCLVYNHFLPWARHVAAKLDIAHAMFWTQSASVFSLYLRFLDDEKGFRDSEIIRILGSEVELRQEDLPQPLREGQEFFLDHLRSHFVDLQCLPWVLGNSFYDLEPFAFDFIRSRSINFVGVGPCVSPLFLSQAVEAADDGIDQRDEYLKWLDEQEENCVVYVAFGSLTTFSDEQVAEIATGIKESGVKFVWVTRGMEDLIPEGFAEETKERGLLLKWCDQLKVLVHASVGGFVTHCGWNSCLESLCSGVPVATFAAWADQNTNSKFLCQQWKTGMRLHKREDGEIIEAQEIERIVRGLVSQSIHATKMRRNGVKWREAAMKALKAGGSSTCSISSFVDDVISKATK